MQVRELLFYKCKQKIFGDSRLDNVISEQFFKANECRKTMYNANLSAELSQFCQCSCLSANGTMIVKSGFEL